MVGGLMVAGRLVMARLVTMATTGVSRRLMDHNLLDGSNIGIDLVQLLHNLAANLLGNQTLELAGLRDLMGGRAGGLGGAGEQLLDQRGDERVSRLVVRRLRVVQGARLMMRARFVVARRTMRKVPRRRAMGL